MVSQNIIQGGGLAPSTKDENKEQYDSKQTTVASSALFDTQSARETSANDISSQKATSKAKCRAGKFPISFFRCITTFQLLRSWQEIDLLRLIALKCRQQRTWQTATMVEHVNL
jgi:hypothetical protein